MLKYTLMFVGVVVFAIVALIMTDHPDSAIGSLLLMLVLGVPCLLTTCILAIVKFRKYKRLETPERVAYLNTEAHAINKEYGQILDEAFSDCTINGAFHELMDIHNFSRQSREIVLTYDEYKKVKNAAKQIYKIVLAEGLRSLKTS